MPGTMTENENQLSLLSVEVLISHVEIDMNIECHLPCIVFRLLDYPAVSIPYFDQWQIEEFHNLKRNYPNVAWRQLLSDQFMNFVQLMENLILNVENHVYLKFI